MAAVESSSTPHAGRIPAPKPRLKYAPPAPVAAAHAANDAKPRLAYGEVFAVKTAPAANEQGPAREPTVGDVLERYIEIVGKLRTFGATHLCAMRALQRFPIAKIDAKKLQPSDVIAHCRLRVEAGVMPATVNQDVTYLRGPLQMAKVGLGIDASAAPILEAMPMLKQLGLVAKSTPRERRPAPTEVARLIAYFEAQRMCKIPMATIARFQIESGRRISETCRLRWDDLNVQDRTILVRDLKDPKRKKGSGNHAEAALLGKSFDIIMAQPRIPGEPRIFPYNSHSCSARYTEAKRELGIVNLRMHDSRRECASRMIEEGFSVPEVMLVTLHKNSAVLTRTYLKLKPADLHLGPAAKRGVAARKDIASTVVLGYEQSQLAA